MQLMIRRDVAMEVWRYNGRQRDGRDEAFVGGGSGSKSNSILLVIRDSTLDLVVGWLLGELVVGELVVGWLKELVMGKLVAGWLLEELVVGELVVGWLLEELVVGGSSSVG